MAPAVTSYTAIKSVLSKEVSVVRPFMSKSKVRSAAKVPPPDKPVPAIICVAEAAPPIFERAVEALSTSERLFAPRRASVATKVDVTSTTFAAAPPPSV
jgi:hypothetical protein